MTPTAQALEELLALAELATPGPWHSPGLCEVHNPGHDVTADCGYVEDQGFPPEQCDHNAALITAAVNFIRTHGPALLAQLGGGREVVVAHDADVRWAVDRWHAEVCQRPLVNVHRRSLDDVWRQVIRHFGGDDVSLCGPRHDDLLAAAPTEPAQAGRDDTSEQTATEGGVA